MLVISLYITLIFFCSFLRLALILLIIRKHLFSHYSSHDISVSKEVYQFFIKIILLRGRKQKIIIKKDEKE